MRIFACLGVALCLSFLATPAQAQFSGGPLPQQPTPRVTTPAPIIGSGEGRVVQNPAGQIFNAPRLTAAQVDVERIRKLGLISRWGLSTGVRNIGASVFLNPQRSFIDANTNIQIFDRGGSVTTSYTLTPDLPWGSYRFHVATNDTGLMMTVPNPAPFAWWLVECYTTGRSRFHLSANFRPVALDRQGNFAQHRIDREQDATNGRMSWLFEPSTMATREFVVTNFDRRYEWVFGGCELTPVRP